jgi:hypothetical protein
MHLCAGRCAPIFAQRCIALSAPERGVRHKMELENIIKQLQDFSDAKDELQLSMLDELIQNIKAGSLDTRIYDSFFRLFERFPESDGFGTFWSVIHFIEACDGFEPLLVESVLRKPCELNLNMINRLLNGGVSKVNNIDLLFVLQTVIKNSEASKDALYWAKDFLTYQQKKVL